MSNTSPFSPSEQRSRAAFLALLGALSRPGTIHTLPGVGAVGEALLDLETTFFTPDAETADRLHRLKARRTAAADAEYHFYLTLTEADLDSIGQAPVGTLEYPDRGATLVVGCTLDAGRAVRLAGPGVDGDIELRVGGLPAGFWELRNARRDYPRGWDVFLIDGGRVAGVPRSSEVEISE